MAPQSGTPSASRSPARSLSSSACDASSKHKWDSFEIRTLICLIIKGAHRNSKGPVDPMDFADKLNKALNPVQTSTRSAKVLFDRDIPVDDVQEMLQRILARKSHAVDVVQRNPAASITKRQVNAFIRQLDFDGGESEWLDDFKREKVMAERAEMRRQLDKRREGRPMSQERWENNQERLQDIHSPRAHRLLSNWGMGKTFFQGELFPHCARWTQTDHSSRAPGPEQMMGPPARGRSLTRRHRSASPIRGDSASPGEITSASPTSNNGGGEGGDHDDPFISYESHNNSNNNKNTSSWDNSLTVHTPAWGPPGHSLRHPAATPNPPIGGWGGGFVQPLTTPQLDGSRGYAPTPSMYGSGKTPTDNHGYGGVHGAASPSV